jgi:hypothetical protein
VPLDENGKFNPDNGKTTKIDKFSVGSMAGIEMALDVCRTQAEWFKEFQMHDLVTFECVGVRKSSKRDQSDMPEFTITVERQ